ncbi:amyloid-beta A4 precursor protein-binding family A member 1-like isoform X14 [Sitophilus oryzae]|uniref:Amyloid-beta A4 precursor protein-binding family A member 1-like isoform X14 n=1 Tax=Sitophilus oryzae TaxID=7048 RepID=A0A6J2XXM9_SITOR|nr:amyloid-beta A4 precursor protein-binding family A member 1-like isoform X14 [Sitophilus oryzae]
MTSLTLPLDNIDVSENTEQISKLFPKCRPRSDINLNPIGGSEKEHECVENATNTAMNTHNENDRWLADSSCTVTRDNNSQLYSQDEDSISDQKVSVGTYKLRDSRIIEIAGGRELYSQSRTKAVKKSKSSHLLGEDGEKKSQKSPMRQGVWELRAKNNEIKKARNSQEYTETIFSSEVCSMTHEKAVQNSSEHLVNSSNMASSGDVVVFDDIGETWSDDKDKSENYEQHDESSNFVATHLYNDIDKVTKVIGSLPIAVYEGSPKRYGPRETVTNSSHIQLPSAQSLLASPSVYPPRPGFPQRIVTSPSPSEREKSLNLENTSYNRTSSPPSINASTFDYLYEFSETRKVLEEFFKCPPEEEETRLDTEFQDLEYELRRQASESGNSYVGKRLANGRSSELDFCMRIDSPRKCVTNSKIPYQERDFVEHENNFLDLSIGTGSSGDLGETEVGLQVGHSRNFTLSPETTDCDSNCGDLDSEVSLMLLENELAPSGGLLGSNNDLAVPGDSLRLYSSMPVLEDGLSSGHASDTDNNNPTVMLMKRQITEIEREINQGLCKVKPGNNKHSENGISPEKGSVNASPTNLNSFEEPLNLSQNDSAEKTPPPPAPAPHRMVSGEKSNEVEAAIKDIRLTLQRTKTLPLQRHLEEECEDNCGSPVWVPSHFRQRGLSITSADSERKANSGPEDEENDTDLETDRLLGQQRTDDQGFYDDKEKDKKKGRNKEDVIQRSVLIEGVLFRARYLGSTQLVCEGQPTKTTRMMQAEEAVSRIKALAPDGETQPSTEVDLFISTEKIMVLNTDLKEIMMDHALRTISYIADIGDLVVLMARRRFVPHEVEDAPKINRTPKMICHVFESEEAQFIAQSIGQAFQVAYMEFLKANGIEDHSFVKEMDYQEVLNSQEIFGDELQMFAKKEMQKEVVVPKAKGEILGVVIVESGWGSMLPTVVIANLAPAGAAARCGQLNIGDQIIAINGVSLVGLPLSTCQNYIKNSKNQTVVKLTVVPCAPVVEVKIKRPDTKYQLGFSVQNGVICSLLRGGIAERGGVRVGHRIIEINNQSVVAVPHEKIVNLLATSVGEILMKTMPTSMFRLLTGQENPVYI